MSVTHDARRALLAHLARYFSDLALVDSGVVLERVITAFNDLHPLFAAYELALTEEVARDLTDVVWQDVTTHVDQLLRVADPADAAEVALLDSLRQWAERRRAQATRP